MALSQLLWKRDNDRFVDGIPIPLKNKIPSFTATISSQTASTIALVR